MYNYDELCLKFHIDKNHRYHLKSIINSLIQNGDAHIQNQKIYVDTCKFEYLWGLYIDLEKYFDYSYNTKKDLTKFFSYILNQKVINFNAIFCPGYTENGYKNYVGNNNTKKLIILKSLKEYLESKKINEKIKISLSDIFLENTDFEKNKNWKEELRIHTKIFENKALEYFDKNEIIFFSKLFSDTEYISGFVKTDILKGKNYENFYKNNMSFYNKMNWPKSEIQKRNDKLYTIYNIISKYILEQSNGIYLPMETMYSRSKVMTYNNVCTMYLKK